MRYLSFNKLDWREDQLIYSDKIKLKNGQTAWIFFSLYGTDFMDEYAVAFAIGNKRKHIKNWLLSDGCSAVDISNVQTGRAGLEGLIWAKNKILEFENFMGGRYKICIYGSDKKRERLYRRGLAKYGYQWDSVYKEMFKFVDKDKKG